LPLVEIRFREFLVSPPVERRLGARLFFRGGPVAADDGFGVVAGVDERAH
jgi:hypothetical protein